MTRLRSQRRAALVLAVHPLLGSPRALCGISNRLLGVLSLKCLLASSFAQIALMSFPLPAFGHSLSEVH